MDDKPAFWRRLSGIALYIAAAAVGGIGLLMVAGCYRNLILSWDHGPQVYIPSLSFALFLGSAIMAAASLLLCWLAGRLIRPKVSPKNDFRTH